MRIESRNILHPLLFAAAAQGVLLGVGGFLPGSAAALVVILPLGVLLVLESVRRPLQVFGITLFVFMTLYTRTSLAVAGGAGEGIGVALADAMGAALAAGCAIRYRSRWGAAFVPRLSPFFWFMAPFQFLMVVLPVLGVLVYEWPWTYALTGIRYLQWWSMGVLVVLLTLDHGVERVTRIVVTVAACAMILHAAHAVLQFGANVGLFSRSLVILDRIHVAQHGAGAMFYTRSTGLLTNPNALGVFSASMLGIMSVARLLTSLDLPRFVIPLAQVGAVVGLVLSASRSALLGVMVALPVVFWGIGRSGRGRGLVLVAIAVLLLGAALLSSGLMPQILSQRFVRFVDVFDRGAAADPTAAIRVEEWGRLWTHAREQYPFGTLVPPSYALRSPVDSYFLVTSLQGTPLLTGFWVLMVLGGVGAGLKALSRPAGASRGAGLALAVVCLVSLGAGVGMSPMPQTQIVIPLWCWAGILYARDAGEVRGAAGAVFLRRGSA